MKLTDKIKHHLTSVILYGSFALFITFMCYVVYVVNFRQCFASAHHQYVLLEVDNALVNQLSIYERKRETLFAELVTAKLKLRKEECSKIINNEKLTDCYQTIFTDFQDNPTYFTQQQLLFSKTLLFWSQNQHIELKNSFYLQNDHIDEIYLSQLIKLSPDFIIPEYEPLANDYYQGLIKHLQNDNSYNQVLSIYINQGSLLDIYSNENHTNFAKVYFANLFGVRSPNDMYKFLDVFDTTNIFEKIFKGQKSKCYAYIDYPKNNHLIVGFNYDSTISTRNSVRYNTSITNIIKDSKPYSLAQFGQDVIKSYQNYDFSNTN